MNALPLESIARPQTDDTALLGLYAELDAAQKLENDVQAKIRARWGELNRAAQPAGPTILDQYDAMYAKIARGEDGYTLAMKAEQERLAAAREAEQKRQAQAKAALEQKIGWTR